MIQEYHLVVLRRDLPEQALEVGDGGVAVEVYPDGSLEVEFVNAIVPRTDLLMVRSCV